MKHLVAGIRDGYRSFQAGKFNDAKNAFGDVLTKIPLVVTDNKGEASEVKEILEICREYITGIRLRGAATECGEDPVRSTELSGYFTHCNLQPAHLLLALRSSMGVAFKHKNYIAAAGFARRLLELPDMSSERNAQLKVKVRWTAYIF
jgi:coatomer protein complex subunit alpha (xenin)